jgi:hypothetical protein
MMKFSFKETWGEARGRAQGLGDTWWSATARDSYHGQACAACGRRIDYLFDFVKMVVLYTPVEADGDGWKWRQEDLGLEGRADHENDLVHSFCFDHGGVTGKRVTSCLTGEEKWMPPRPLEFFVCGRNLCQLAVLDAAIGIRFVWYLAKFLSWAVIVRIYWRWLQWRHK